MTLADYDTFQVGAAKFPLTSSTANSLLFDADQGLYQLINFLVSVINTYAGDRWNAECLELGLNSLVGGIVKTTINHDPVPNFQQAQFQLPLLAIYRSNTSYQEFTINRHRKIDTWKIDYILPPLTPGQLERLFPILNSIESIIMNRLMLGFDPFYQSGARILGADHGYLDWIRLMSRTMDQSLQFPGDATSPIFQLLHMEIEVKERDLITSDSFEGLAGIDGYVFVANDGYDNFLLAQLKLE